jgi:Na+/H+ antiporter 1
VEEQELNDFALRELRRLARETQSPLHRAETRLSPVVAFLIVPVFAFANAGLTVPTGKLWELFAHPVVSGIAGGLVLGKAIGVFCTTWLVARLGWGRMPAGMSAPHLFGIALCAGIGFTVALFVAGLSFDDPGVTEAARFGIMGGSVIAAILGYFWLRLTETFLLAEQARGVGVIPRRRWAAHAPFTRTHFGIPEDRLVVCGMSFGWPDRDHAANGFRTRRASTEDNITWIQ